MWTRDYPQDFAVRGTAGALNALVRAVVAKTYLLHYGSDFLSFAESVAGFKDEDATWAMPVEDIADENDESYSLYEDEEEMPDILDSPVASSIDHSMTNHGPISVMVSSRERKPSLPLPNFISSDPDMMVVATAFSADDPEFKRLLKDLVRNSQELALIDSAQVAEEITRIEAKYFLDIRVCLPMILANGYTNSQFYTAETLASLHVSERQKGS